MQFSILVPVYNVEKYIHQCIDSIIKQTNQDFELIIVNDGSTDNSGEICEQYRSKYPDKIIVINQENRGLLLARRAAISRARGNYVIFVDSDDYLRADALEVIERAINQYEVDLVIYKYAYVTDEAKASERKADFLHGEIFPKDNRKKIYERILKSSTLNNLVTKAVKLDLIDVDVDYSEMSHVSNAEDLLQSLPMITNAERIVYLDEAIYFYRNNVTSITKTFNSRAYASFKTVSYQLMKYLILWGMDNEHGRELLNQRRLKTTREAIGQLFLCGASSDAERKQYLLEIADDSFFTEAYDNVMQAELKPAWCLVLCLLRKKRITEINLLIKIFQSVLLYRHKFHIIFQVNV